MFTVYPAIDLRGGKVVRLKAGNPARMTLYSNDPAETAKRWIDAGATWLHVVNLDGAWGANDNANRAALEAILKLGAQVQFGGGMRSLNLIEAALSWGVARVILGTIAIEQPEIVHQAATRFGVERVAVGIDARDGLARTRGWKDNSGVPVLALALQMRDLGLTTVIFTDVSRDGLGNGLNIPATRALSEKSGLKVIASGGARTIDDVRAAKEAGLAGCVIGRALYEGTMDLGKALQV